MEGGLGFARMKGEGVPGGGEHHAGPMPWRSHARRVSAVEVEDNEPEAGPRGERGGESEVWGGALVGRFGGHFYERVNAAAPPRAGRC